ncbi:MAG: FAD binding domain-containing protein [Pararhodobacter sp.]
MARYLRPQTLDQALAALQAEPGLRVIAGGTDVYPALGDAAARAHLLDITGLTDLRGVHTGDDGLRIGALASWTDVQRAALAPGYRALQQAGREVGSVQIQNAGTVAGNVVNASPAADGTVALMALDAQVEIAGPQGSRRVPLSDFVTGVRRVALAPGELVVGLHLPPAPGRSAFLKLGARRYLVISIVMVAAHVACDDQGAITRASVAVGACSPVARRLPGLEAALVGARRADLAQVVRGDLVQGLAPISDVRAGADYRADAVPVLIRRALAAAMEDMG